MRRAQMRMMVISLLAIALIGCTAKPESLPTPTFTTIPAQPTSTIAPNTATATRPPSTATNIPRTATAAPSTTTAPLPGGATARLNEPFTIKLGQWATLSEDTNTRIFFTTILQDTRCAIEINCYQAGFVRVAITMESGGKSAKFDLSTKLTDYRRVSSFNGYRIELLDFGPQRSIAETPESFKNHFVTLRVSKGSLNVSPAKFNEPFTLKLGQSIGFDGSPMQLTFESVKQDSRCPMRAVCATSGSAIIVAHLIFSSVTQEQITLTVEGNGVMTSYPAVRAVSVTVFASALTPYPQQEFASKEITSNEYEATFLVVNPVAIPPTPISRETTTTGCTDLTRGDASEILGEPINENPVEMFFFQPPNTLTVMFLHGLCGYGSVAFTPSSTAPKNVPSVFPTTILSNRAVIAGKLADSKRQEQLVSIASAINTTTTGDSNLYNKMLTYNSAGVWTGGILNEFLDATRNAPNVSIRPIANLGDNAIWVWREFNGGRYAALAAQKGNTLLFISAITNEQRKENDVLNTMTPIIQKMAR